MIQPEGDPELMYECTEEYAEMRKLQGERLDFGDTKAMEHNLEKLAPGISHPW
jgi:hypothetical protein